MIPKLYLCAGTSIADELNEHAFHTVVTYRFDTIEQMIEGLAPTYFPRATLPAVPGDS